MKCVHCSGGPIVDPNMQFSLISPRDADPPEFTLTFNVSFGPPTMVTCAVDETNLNIGDRDVVREVVQTYFNETSGDPDRTKVQVTLRQRIQGNYNCTVSIGVANKTINYTHFSTGSSSANVTGMCYIDVQ